MPHKVPQWGIHLLKAGLDRGHASQCIMQSCRFYTTALLRLFVSGNHNASSVVAVQRETHGTLLNDAMLRGLMKY